MSPELTRFEGFFACPFDGNQGRIALAIEEMLRAETGQPDLTLATTNPSGIIVRAIIEDIELADFVVADLRMERANVTFESAFAECMAKPVLYVHVLLLGVDEPKSYAPFDLENVNIAVIRERADGIFVADNPSLIRSFAQKLVKRQRVNGVIETLLGDPPFLISPAQKAADAYCANFIKPITTTGIPVEIVIPTSMDLANERSDYQLALARPLLVPSRDRYIVCEVAKGAIHDWPTTLTPIVNFYSRRISSSLQHNLEEKLQRIWRRESGIFREAVEHNCRGLDVRIVTEPGSAWQRKH